MIRLATIGTSGITERFADAVVDVDGIRIDVAYSRDAARARAFADRLGIAGATTDLAALLRSGEIDAVYVGSPNGAHAAQVRDAIDAGIHVFVEKPATPTAGEFADLVRAPRDRGVVVFEGMRNVYDPGMAQVAALLPRIGRQEPDPRPVRDHDPALAGGALFDLGVYPLSAVVHLFGAPASVTGSTVAVATGADGAGAALLTYPEFVAQVSFSKIGFSHRPNEIQGELGTIEIDEITRPREIALSLRDGTRTAEHVDGAENNMVYEVARFADLIRGDDPTPDQERSLAVLRAVEANHRKDA